MKKDSEFFLCECNSETLIAQRFDDEWDDYIYLSIHSLGYKRRMNFWERVKYALKYIKTGRAYEDEIVLSKESAEDLGNWLIKKTKK